MSTTLIKMEPQCRCFSVNFVNFFESSKSIKHVRQVYVYDSSKLVAKLLKINMRVFYIFLQFPNFHFLQMSKISF